MQQQLNLALETSIAITLVVFSGFLIWGGRRRTRALYFLAALTGTLGIMVAINTVAGHALAGLRNDVNLLLELTIGPLLYLYVSQVQLGAARPSPWTLLHLLPAVVGLTIWKTHLVRSMDAFVLAVTVIYLGMSWLGFWRHRQAIQATPLFRFLGTFLTLFTVLMGFRGIVALAAGADHAFQQSIHYTALLGILLVVVWVVVLTALRYPDLLSAPETYIQYAQSGADAEVLGKLEKQLVRLMKTEKPHLRPDLTIEEVARRLQTRPRHLSQLTNSRFGLTFPAYINTWRVREAARLLRSDPSKPVKAVMYDSGFRSKSAFNREFQRQMGVTPTLYRQSSDGCPGA